jgi:hypothetical protein
MPTIRSSSSARARAGLRFILRWVSSTSPTWKPRSRTGLSADVGCWKIIEIRLPRSSRIWESESFSRSWPSKVTSPDSIRPGGWMRRMIESEVTLFPQPDSPTSPSTSPRRTLKSTPVTARTTPSPVRKEVRRPRTSSSSSPMAPLGRRWDSGTSSEMTVSSMDGTDVAPPPNPTPGWPDVIG